MNKIQAFIILIIVFTLVSCSSFQRPAEKRCPNIPKTGFVNIITEPLEYETDGVKMIVNEVRYECVYSAFYTQKVLFDTFGKWSRFIVPTESNKTTILVWENVKIFNDLNQTFTIYADGKESYETTYASIIIFDIDKNDVLSDDSEYKDDLIKYFGNLINQNDSEKGDFYELYWTTFNPEVWKKMLEYRENGSRTKKSRKKHKIITRKDF